MLAGEFGRDVRQVGIATAGPPRVVALLHVAVAHVAGLGHEAVDDAVEGDVVVGAGAHQLLDLLDMLGREVRPQRDRHVAVLQRDDHGVLGIGGECRRDEGGGEKRENGHERRGEPCKMHGEFSESQFLNLATSGLTTAFGTKGRMSPPIDAIWRTSVAVMVRTEGLAGRKTVCSSGAIVSFMPAICIS